MASHRRIKLLTAGSRAPDFRLPQLNGGFGALHGGLIEDGPILLAFFKVTCPVCQLTLPFLDRLHQGAAPGSIRIFGVSQDDPEDTREFNRVFGVTFPMLLDPEDDDFAASNAYGISSVPTLFLVEPDSKVSRVIEGWNRKEIEWLGSKMGVAPFRRDDHVPEWKAG